MDTTPLVAASKRLFVALARAIHHNTRLTRTDQFALEPGCVRLHSRWPQSPTLRDLHLPKD